MSKKSYIEKPCVVCGKIITTRKDKPSKTCGMECMGILRSITAGVIRKCAFCGKTFHFKKKEAMYCSAKCSFAARSKPLICEICGAEFVRPPCHATGHRYCSRECTSKAMSIYNTGENHPNWNGGVWHSEGYIFNRVNGTYKGVHRLVMERHIGRKLSDDEIIHHLDGNKTNNSIENLVIVSRSEHIEIHRDCLYAERRKLKKEKEVKDATM